MITPNFGLLSTGVLALCLGTFLSVKEQGRKQFRCPKCGATKMKAKAGDLVCVNGHTITIDIRQMKADRSFFSSISGIFK